MDKYHYEFISNKNVFYEIFKAIIKKSSLKNKPSTTYFYDTFIF